MCTLLINININNPFYIPEEDLIKFSSLFNHLYFLKEGWCGNGVYNDCDDFIISYEEWIIWDKKINYFILNNEL
ncbi:MAG: hypothetical protein CL832_07685 [Crocinitomicaceae bacterium]|nr:hypothetical protein [Crocinitomicaceae bacterium]MAW84266.1 hypothetical protein [Crocinitomicaceae bacterium]